MTGGMNITTDKSALIDIKATYSDSVLLCMISKTLQRSSKKKSAMVIWLLLEVMPSLDTSSIKMQAIIAESRDNNAYAYTI